MQLIRTEISKWTALFDSIIPVPVVIGMGSTQFMINSESLSATTEELDEDAKSNDISDRSGSSGSEMENEDGTEKRKKRKRIITRSRKVIPGLSFLILHFLLEY